MRVGPGTLGCFVALLGGCGGDAPPVVLKPPPQRVQESILDGDGSDAPAPPQFLTGGCRVYTSEPGWAVFIDGYPVRDAQDEHLRTPCRVQATAASHAITIARDGTVDLSRQVLFAEHAEVIFDTSSATAGESLLLTAPYLDLPVGEPRALATLNTAGKEFDPFLSADGRGIVFAADRSAGRGIYTASRPSPLHPFDPPALLRLTSSSDQPASPSINGDATKVVYCLPSKGRIRALTRPSPLADFADPEVLLADEELDARYPSAQIVAAGDRIYFTRELAGVTETRVAVPTPTKPQPFGDVRIVVFPGDHPRLSSDGLRQYLFNGRTLSRARRTAPQLPFQPAERIAEVTIPGYRPSSGHRQFCVSEDEQWLIYSDDPLGTGDLWIVRVHNGPGWGVPLTGATIDPRPIVAAAEPEMRREEPLFAPPTSSAEEAPPDPRAQPLPYVAFQAEQLIAISDRDFGRALDLIEAAQSNPELQAVAELIEWDRQDVQQLIQFEQDTERGAAALQPGAKLRFGSLAVEFEKYADGVITAKARTKSVDKPLRELDAVALVSIAEAATDPTGPEAALRAAVALTYLGGTASPKWKTLLADAGAAGSEFIERLAEREVALVKLELAREHIPAALARIETLEQQHPQSQAAQGAEALRESLYERTLWRIVGGRRWERGPQGEFTADSTRSAGAHLQSPEPVRDFSLTLEYRTNAPNGQGGVYFGYSGSGSLDENARKVQLSNDAGVNPDPYCTGALFGRSAPALNAAKAQGEWNTLAMTVRGPRVQVTINGREVLKELFTTDADPAAGYLGLDGATGGISYRKIILSVQPATR